MNSEENFVLAGKIALSILALQYIFSNEGKMPIAEHHY